MALHPETAKIVQAEIDSVVGRARIPELSDREALPFLEAVLQEVMRLCTVAPLGMAMLRDPKHYLSPNTFDPTRFLKANPDPDPRKYIFGFGRRVCPGPHVANNSTWIMCAGVLSVFDIHASPELAAKVDALGGRQSERLYELFASSGVSDPLPFSASFIQRDAAAAALIESLDG
ncbi:hypothetical protein FS749_005916 [Ceratobasidium sp. UAMH 11750]|nr:hypothetical protein FS749_005916 [Ceratobasidium sp. UAMH 11750]